VLVETVGGNTGPADDDWSRSAGVNSGLLAPGREGTVV